jgi:hypothetical protein
VVAALIVVVLFTAERPGVLPDTPWSCPATHPIKGYASAEDALRRQPTLALTESTLAERRPDLTHAGIR